ncbi:MAG: VWA domain-containing protein [Candidatus Marinimicrobia bacterium]|nr:VWA domain-containing protein [Candidatus Neomarinimicrobiota bacterium]
MRSVSLQFQNLTLWILPVILAVLLVLYLSYRRERSQSAWFIPVLIVLRSVVFFCIVILILKPLISWEVRKNQKPLIVLFADQSLSMIAHDGISADSIRSIVSDLKTSIEKRGARVAIMPFGLNVDEEQKYPKELSFNCDGTNISGVLDYCNTYQDDWNVRAAVLVTDGVSTAGEDPLMFKMNPRFSIFPIGIGDSLLIMDPAVIDLSMPSKASVGDSILIEARVFPFGYGNTLSVWLKKDDQIIQKKTISTYQKSLVNTVQFTTIPDQPGITNYSVLIDTVRDRNLQNNEQKSLLRVYNNKQRLAIIQGHNSFDCRYFSMMARTFPELEIINLFSYKGKWHYDSKTDPFQVKWDAIALFGFPSQEINADQLNQISAKIAGDRPAQYIHYLPAITFDKFDRIFPEPVIRRYRLNESKIPAVLCRINEENQFHPILMNLRSEKKYKNDWADLPPIGMPFKEIQLSDDYITILESDDQKPMPILSMSETGGIRKAVVTGVDLWRWNMMTNGADNHYIYPELMASVLKWLLDTLSTSNLQFSLNKDIYLKGEIAEISGIITDVKGGVISNAILTAELIGDGNKSTNFLIQWDGTKYRGEIPLKEEGDHRVIINAVTDEFNLGEYRKNIQVLRNSVEHQTIRQDVETLKGIASKTHGAYFTPENYRNIINAVSFESEIHTSLHTLKLWRWPGIFILLFFAMAIEWVIRRISGYQ